VAGSVSVPTSGTFSGTPTGIAASAGLGTLTGTVAIAIPTSGYLDASCNLVLKTTTQNFNVTFAGAPSVSITNQGSVSGSVTLSGLTDRAVSISGPTVTLNKSSATVTPEFAVKGGSVSLSGSTSTSLSITAPAITLNKSSATVTPEFTVKGGTISLSGSTNASLSITAPTIKLNKESGSGTASLSVTGGTFTPTTSTSKQDVTVTTTAASVTITTESQNIQLSATGEIQAPYTKEAALANSEVSLTPGTSNKTLKLKVAKKSDFLIYLRPRA
jgi:hypothetical protein